MTWFDSIDLINEVWLFSIDDPAGVNGDILLVDDDERLVPGSRVVGGYEKVIDVPFAREAYFDQEAGHRVYDTTEVTLEARLNSAAADVTLEVQARAVGSLGPYTVLDQVTIPQSEAGLDSERAMLTVNALTGPALADGNVDVRLVWSSTGAFVGALDGVYMFSYDD